MASFDGVRAELWAILLTGVHLVLIDLTPIYAERGAYGIPGGPTVRSIDPLHSSNTKTVEVQYSHITNWAHVLQIPQFDPDLGTLAAAKLTLHYHMDAEVHYENTGDCEYPCILQSNLTGNVETEFRNADNQTIFEPEIDVANSQSIASAPYDGQADFDGPSGGIEPQDAEGERRFDLEGELLNVFVGRGTVPMHASTTTQSGITGSGNVMAMYVTTGILNVRVSYVYHPPISIGLTK